MFGWVFFLIAVPVVAFVIVKAVHFIRLATDPSYRRGLGILTNEEENAEEGEKQAIIAEGYRRIGVRQEQIQREDEDRKIKHDQQVEEYIREHGVPYQKRDGLGVDETSRRSDGSGDRNSQTG